MDFEMQRLEPGMMARYDIEDHRPTRVNAVQFGMSEALLGTVDRLIDDARLDVGIACVDVNGAGFADKLNAQSGLYTLIVRGYVNDEAVRREQVAQCVLTACGPEGLGALAKDPEIQFGIVDDDDNARAMAERFNETRQAEGLEPVFMIRLGVNALADSLAFRSEPDEAARQCAEMNYLDEMLHIAEPHARLTLVAPEELPRRFPLDRAPDVHFVDSTEMVSARRLQAQVFDAGLFLMAAAGWLNGCDTLRDCMTHERLRAFVGHAVYDELLPADPARRDDVAAYAIQCFERFENPLNRSDLLDCAHPLLGRFVRGVLPLMRAYADEHFEPPRLLSFALAATIMLYAGARKNAGGVYEVARTGSVHLLADCRNDQIRRYFPELSRRNRRTPSGSVHIAELHDFAP